jgi:hypothetical protein
MSFSNFSSITSSQASYSGLQNYANNSGIGSLNLDKSIVDSWSADKAAVFQQPFSTSTNVPDYAGDVLNTPSSGGNASAFTFITAPGQVSYSQGAEVNQVSIFGTNNPPLTVAGRNAGELQLGDALMEGFILGKQVELSINQLFAMQQVVLDSKAGFVNVPVYTVFAGPEVGSGKPYGDFVIENIQVDEEMRDLGGKATRARVSVTFREVPKYQISTGMDQSTSTTAGQEIKPSQMTNQGATQDAAVSAARTNTPAATPRPAAASSTGGGGGGSSGGQAPAVTGAGFGRVRLRN